MKNIIQTDIWGTNSIKKETKAFILLENNQPTPIPSQKKKH